MIPAAVDFAVRDGGTDGERSAGAGGTASTAAGNAASSGGAALPSPPPPPGTASPPPTAAAAAAQHPAAAGSVAPPVFADQNRCWIASLCFFSSSFQKYNLSIKFAYWAYKEQSNLFEVYMVRYVSKICIDVSMVYGCLNLGFSRERERKVGV